MMMLKSPNRSQRTKGLRTKLAFQAFLVIALCIWLLYEVKHSYSVEREDAEGNVEASQVAMLRGDKEVRLGRKSLDPRESPRTEVKGNDFEEEEEMLKQEEGEADDEAEQSMEDLIDEEDKEKENEVEDSVNVDRDDQDGDEGEINTQDSWDENFKNSDGSDSGSAED